MYQPNDEIPIQLQARPVPSGLLTRCLNVEGRAQLADISKDFKFSPDSVIFERDSAPASVWILTTGSATLLAVKHSAGIDVTGGDLCGLTETMADIPHQATLVCDSGCICQNISREDLLVFLYAQPATCSLLLHELSKTFHDTTSDANS